MVYQNYSKTNQCFTYMNKCKANGRRIFRLLGIGFTLWHRTDGPDFEPGETRMGGGLKGFESVGSLLQVMGSFHGS